jgi:hypothetical protein
MNELDLNPRGDVCTPTSRASSRDAEEVVAEEGGEEIGKPTEVECGGAETAAAETCVTEAVVQLSALGVREDLVRLDDLPETVLRIGRIRDVGMELTRQSTEGTLDVLRTGVAGNAQKLVVVAFCRGHGHSA